MDDGVFPKSKSWFLSMHEKPRCAKTQSWRGRPFSLEEESSFDVSSCWALTACLNVIQEQGQDRESVHQDRRHPRWMKECKA